MTTNLAGQLPPAIRIRPIRPSDAVGLRAFYAGLTDESRRTRFFGVTSGIGAGQSSWFCHPDHAHREGFVAVTPGSRGRIVGHVCVEPVDRASAEVAVAVDDAWQGHGIGRRLVVAAIEAARRDGYHQLVATMLAGNPAIQRLLASVDLPMRSRPVGAGVVEATLELDRLSRVA
jgi:GNAT superfamily N-acetyltransferase